MVKSNNSKNSTNSDSKDTVEQRRTKIISLFGTMTTKDMAIILGVTQRTIERDIHWLKNDKNIKRRGLIAEDLMKLEAESQTNRLRTQVSFAWEDLLKAREELDFIRAKKQEIKMESESFNLMDTLDDEQLRKAEMLSKAWDRAIKDEFIAQDKCLRLQFEHRSAETVLARFYLLTGGYQQVKEDKDLEKKPMIIFNNMENEIPTVEDDTKRIDKGEMEDATKTNVGDPFGSPPESNGSKNRSAKRTAKKRIISPK